jgi:hypothetical protein
LSSGIDAPPQDIVPVGAGRRQHDLRDASEGLPAGLNEARDQSAVGVIIGSDQDALSFRRGLQGDEAACAQGRTAWAMERQGDAEHRLDALADDELALGVRASAMHRPTGEGAERFAHWIEFGFARSIHHQIGAMHRAEAALGMIDARYPLLAAAGVRLCSSVATRRVACAASTTAGSSTPTIIAWRCRTSRPIRISAKR